MQGVVLAAGEGTRMGELTEARPKVLVPVAGEPLLSYGLDALVELGVDELVVVVGYRASDVIERFGDAYDGVPITYVHQRERLGLAHALLQARPHVDDDFVLLNGDNVCDANLADLVERHRATDAAVTALVQTVDPAVAARTGVFAFDEEGSVAGMVEKPDDPPSQTVPRGIYAFSPVVFHACELVQPSDRGEYELSDAIDLLIAAGRHVETVPLEGWCVNVNEPADRDDVERRLDEA